MATKFDELFIQFLRTNFFNIIKNINNTKFSFTPSYFISILNNLHKFFTSTPPTLLIPTFHIYIRLTFDINTAIGVKGQTASK